METAKVDIRKLQQLNDRINQCLDALNQVRLSVHGLSHTAAPGPVATVPFTGYGSIQDPRVGFAIQDPRLAFGIGAVSPSYEGGISHTTFPQVTSTFSQVAPFAQMLGQPMASQIPQIPIWSLQAGGLSHTGAAGLEAAAFGTYGRPIWADPGLAARVAQTFPYVQFAVPPVVSLF